MTQLRLANDGIAICHSLKEMSDEWLVAAAKNGNVTAFAELRDRHFRSIMRTTYRITGNGEDAEDALQDTFLKAFIHLSKFEGRSSFLSWVTRIAINASLMTLRKKRANKDISIDACNNDGTSDDRWEMPDLREDPERCYSQREREDLLRRAIRRLRPNLRTALELQQAQEYSTREIPDSLGISSAAAKSRLLRARLSLRARLRRYSLRSYQSGNARSID
jgi:RNA polymerase sigma-70 factor, ECF subfamily